MSTLLSIPPGVSPPEQEPAPQTPPSSAPAVTNPHLGPSSGTIYLTGQRLCPLQRLPPK